eukprot:NODE_7042_length_817_cov_30.844380_g6439_i0.p2 GENE.NODE_7042_length_817_cov_30.844380_g6439_i0~~NODE_7042_length_817_cov_30.844380_g6439_i0.p2  ORF type:complete len:100 (-),score=20.27 NODE_7042_length_817_cov_30.844380_g6439_i0:464-763(-)
MSVESPQQEEPNARPGTASPPKISFKGAALFVMAAGGMSRVMDEHREILAKTSGQSPDEISIALSRRLTMDPAHTADPNIPEVTTTFTFGQVPPEDSTT